MGGYDYTAVGHVTADVFADGSVRPGGSALYSALQAARLGRRALIITQGVEQQIAELLAPYGEFAGIASVYMLAGYGRGLLSFDAVKAA